MSVPIREPNRTRQRSPELAAVSHNSADPAKDPVEFMPTKAVTPVPPTSLTGEELVSLMRNHQMTASALAMKVGATLRCVRKLCRSGLTDPHAIRYWLEAITGEDPGPRRFYINSVRAGTECSFCRFPMFHDDVAWAHAGDVFCTLDCCRRSGGQ